MAALVSTGMGDSISMLISGDSPSETLNCSCGDSMNFPLRLISKCKFLFFFFIFIKFVQEKMLNRAPAHNCKSNFLYLRKDRSIILLDRMLFMFTIILITIFTVQLMNS